MAIELTKNGAFMLNILPALDEEGTSFSYECEAEPFSAEEYDIAFAAPVQLKFDYIYSKGRLILNGRIKAKLSAVCDRCLKDISESINIRLSEVLYKSAPDEDDEAYLYDGDKICLDKVVLDNISLNMPQKNLCKEDCKGLCPVCGVDLNEKTCSCQAAIDCEEAEEEPANNPFAKLAGLFTDDEEV